MQISKLMSQNSVVLEILPHSFACHIFSVLFIRERKTKGMFGNCFFPLFFIFKNNFLFLRLKNLFGNSKRAENKNCFQNSICEGN